jgi:sialic acid synthase SpsE
MVIKMKIRDRYIGEGYQPYVVAEIGINHNGDMEKAKELIDRAKWARASAVKLQTYITEKRVPKDSPIYSLLKQCELSFEQQENLFRYAREKEIEIFSTPFDDESVDFLTSVDTACFKIASFDVVNKKLLIKISEQGKPVIMSRGMANKQEIDKAVGILNDHKLDFALLHCISAYPVSSLTVLNLRTIQALKDRYGCTVGLSDHTIGIEAAKYAVAAGATIIEKHFTLSRKSEGPDHAISAEPEQLKELVDSTEFVHDIMGEAIWSSTEAESDILQYRRHS